MSLRDIRRLQVYSVYGLNLASEIPLPDLRPSQTNADAAVLVKRLDREEILAGMISPERFDRQSCVVHMSPNVAFYEWQGLAKGLVQDGREIVIDPEPGKNADELAPLVVGALLGILLAHRGALVLHGSFVRINKRGFGFLGEKGMGKSTLAAYLTWLGHELVTDDLLPMFSVDEGSITKPGYPRIRLWPDSFSELGLGRKRAEESSPLIPKGSVKPENFSDSDEIGVDALFVLDEGQDVSLERIPQTDALIELIRNTYLNRYLEAAQKTVENFRRCERLARQVPVYRLRRPLNYELLPDVAGLLEELEVGDISRPQINGGSQR